MLTLSMNRVKQGFADSTMCTCGGAGPPKASVPPGITMLWERVGRSWQARTLWPAEPEGEDSWEKKLMYPSRSLHSGKILSLYLRHPLPQPLSRHGFSPLPHSPQSVKPTPHPHTLHLFFCLDTGPAVATASLPTVAQTRAPSPS